MMPSCLSCGHILRISTDGSTRCSQCSHIYNTVLGIPDMRARYATQSEAEDGIVEMMVRFYHGSTFDELLNIRLENSDSSEDLHNHIYDCMRNANDRGQKMVGMFHKRLFEFYSSHTMDVALDIGCGSGSSLLALSRLYRHVVGIEPSMANAILARKLLELHGAQNVTIIQGYGQLIPYPERSFDYVNALNVLEHLFDLNSVLAEVYRVLRKGGHFAGDSRNRYDLLFPEPHVKVRWVGIVPRRWQQKYVLWRKGIGYDVTYLLSYNDLTKGLQNNFGDNFQITYPSIDAYGYSQKWGALMKLLEKTPILGTLGLQFFPSHLALAERSG